GWTAISTLLLFVAAALLLASFVRIEARTRDPLVPVAALRHRTLVAANLSAFLTFSAFFSFIFLATLLMQQVLGYSPTKTGVAWLATSLTAFAGSAVAGARLVTVVGVRKLLVTGLSLLAIGMLWLTRVPADANYVTDLLPAFLLAGVAIGLCAPSAQIGALSGVSESTSGLASGLVETMREIGGAAGVAAVSTVLVSRAGLDGFRAAFVVICIAAALGAVTAGVAFPRRTRSAAENVPMPETAGDTALVPVPSRSMRRTDDEERVWIDQPAARGATARPTGSASTTQREDGVGRHPVGYGDGPYAGRLGALAGSAAPSRGEPRRCRGHHHG
ncbi:MAG: MFS transporter, partial [Candidatus Limnocylindrales bacterium]